jgi:hypothetical protein
MNFFHSQKKDINFYKIFSWEKIFIKSPFHPQKKMKKKRQTHPLSPTTPSHATKKIIPWKVKKTLAFLPWESTKFLPPMRFKKQTLRLVPISNKIHFSHSFKKNLLEKGGIDLSYPSPHPKRTFLILIFFS